MLFFHPNGRESVKTHYESKNVAHAYLRDPSITLIKIKEIYSRGKQHCKADPTFDHFPLEHRRSRSEIFESMPNVSLCILLLLIIVNVSSLGLIKNNTSTRGKLTYKTVVYAMVS